MANKYLLLKEFCLSWQKKANRYKGAGSSSRNCLNAGRFPVSEQLLLSNSVDRFITTYTVYNRIYTEIGFLMLRRGSIKGKKSEPYRPLPDRESATQHTVRYYDAKLLKKDILGNSRWKESVDNLINAFNSGYLYFHIDYLTGTPDYVRDGEVFTKVREYNPFAIQELIYQARCNLFHGQKELICEQKPLLDSMSNFLSILNTQLLAKLEGDLVDDF